MSQPPRADPVETRGPEPADREAAKEAAYQRDIMGACRPQDPAARTWHREGFVAGWLAAMAAADERERALSRVDVHIAGPMWNARRIVTDAGYAAECAEHLKDTEGVAATVTKIAPGEALELLNDLLDRDARALAALPVPEPDGSADPVSTDGREH